MRVAKAKSEPIRSGMTVEERWKGRDNGVIAAWERGREISAEVTGEAKAMTARARAGELLVLPWRGGVERALKAKKYGTMRYLAMWQGLRGDDLDVDLDADMERTCSATGVTVTYTNDTAKFVGEE